MKILYICTHNRCRSILCEAITNASNGNVEARSAGSQPVGEVHPLSLKYLAERGFSTDGLQSQSWDEFEDYWPPINETLFEQWFEVQMNVMSFDLSKAPILTANLTEQ